MEKTQTDKTARQRLATSLTREGVIFITVVLLLFLGASLREVNLLLLLASLLCCVFLVTWRLGRRTLRDLKVRRILTSQCYAGEMFVVTLELENTRKKLPAWAVVVEDSLQFGNGNDRNNGMNGIGKRVLRPAVFFEYVPALEKRKKTYAGILPQRGRYQLGTLTLSTRFPCGLFRIRREMNDSGKTSTLTILPRLGKLSSHWLARAHEATETRHRLRFRPSRVSGEFLGLRNWRSGDLRRWIHWRASVRHGQLVVRQFEQHRNHDATVLLDLYQPETPGVREMENIELAVSLAATLLTEMSRHGVTNLSLGVYDPVEQRAVLLDGPVSTPLLDSMLEALATIEPTSQDMLQELFRSATAGMEQRGDIFLISPRALDVASTTRLDELRGDSRFRQMIGRIRVTDTSNPELSDFFTYQ